MSANAKTKGVARMGYSPGESRHQMSWRPETIDDDLGEEPPVRFLDAFVDPLDLEP
jgi:hypothetical protein